MKLTEGSIEGNKETEDKFNIERNTCRWTY